MSSSSLPASPEPRRRVPRWLKVLVVVLLVVANLAVLGLIWAINTGENLLADADVDEEVVSALTPAAGDTLNFLVVGSDSREGLDDLTNFGSFGGERGDVIMVVHVDPDSGPRILSIPRDLWVEIPGHGEDKINSAYAFGGASLMVETVQQNLGIPINHYVEIGFAGFQAMIDEMGGITITFDYPARDLKSGLDVDAGSQQLNGEQALAFARSRSYQEYRNGQWVSVEANDIGRTGRQREVMGAILASLKSPSSLTEAGDIVDGVSDHLTIDATLAESSAAGLFWDFRSVLTAGIDGVTLPVYSATIGGKSVVIADQPSADQAVNTFLS